MKNLITMLMCVGCVCLAWGDSTTHLSLDTQEGTRVAAAVEEICFSPTWETESDSAYAIVSIDGVVMTNATEAGVYAWTPTRNGIYTLMHQVTEGGEAIGETLTTTFVAEGLNPASPVPSDPIPEIAETATSSEIAAALAGSTDVGLVAHIKTVAQYKAYRAWAETVKGPGGVAAGKQAVKDSAQAWLSFALDSDVLLAKAPEQGEMMVASFERNTATGKFEFAV